MALSSRVEFRVVLPHGNAALLYEAATRTLGAMAAECACDSANAEKLLLVLSKESQDVLKKSRAVCNEQAAVFIDFYLRCV